MKLMSLDSLDEFSPELYVAILSDIAHSDGIDPEEQAILERYASQFGVDLDDLPRIPTDLSEVSWPTRVLLYRDAFMLALADGTFSSMEEDRLAELAMKMRLPDGATAAIRAWAEDYGNLLDRFHDLLATEPRS